MSEGLAAFFEFTGKHRRKIMLFPIFFLVFLYLLFPFNDLGDLVSSKITELSGNQVFVSFDYLGLGLVPQPHINLDKVSIESSYFPKIAIKSLSFAPNLTGLLSFKPGVNVSAEGIFGGDIDIYTRGGEKVSGDKTGRYKMKFSADLSQVNMTDLSKSLSLPVGFQGQANGEVAGQVDPLFVEQPTGDVSLKVDKAKLLAGNIPTPFGALAVPGIDLSTIILQAKKDSKSERPDSLDITQFSVGKPGGDLYATVVGRMDVKFVLAGNGVVPQFGGFDLTIRLQLGEVLRNQLGIFLNFISEHQKSPGSYAFRIVGLNFYSKPQFFQIK